MTIPQCNNDRQRPTHLYKFRAWDITKKKHDRDILTHRVLFFASPALFNDPFDCAIPLRYDRMTDEQFEARVRFIEEHQNPGISPSEVEKRVATAVKNSPVRDPSRREEVDQQYRSAIADQYGVLSFSLTEKNLLLWAHYADCHRGYCVRLDYSKLNKLCCELFITDKHIVIGYHVEYCQNYPILIPTNENETAVYRKMLTTKDANWRYEKEYRFIYHGRANLSRYVEPDVITAVYLVLKMPQNHKDEIVDLVRTKLPHAEIYEAHRSMDAFAVEFEPL